MTSDEAQEATREQLQKYLEMRGFAVFENEETDDLRIAALQDIGEIEQDVCDCACPPQMVDNVKHMSWFKKAVEEEQQKVNSPFGQFELF